MCRLLKNWHCWDYCGSECERQDSDLWWGWQSWAFLPCAECVFVVCQRTLCLRSSWKPEDKIFFLVLIPKFIDQNCFFLWQVFSAKHYLSPFSSNCRSYMVLRLFGLIQEYHQIKHREAESRRYFSQKIKLCSGTGILACDHLNFYVNKQSVLHEPVKASSPQTVRKRYGFHLRSSGNNFSLGQQTPFQSPDNRLHLCGYHHHK